MLKKLFLPLLVVFLATSCGPKVYEAPNANQLANRHEVIAIMPPQVSIKGRPKDDPEMLRNAELNDRDLFQYEIFSWILRRKQQNRILIIPLDIETTNAKLVEAGYFDGVVKAPYEWAELLGVDAILTSKFRLSKPMSEGAAVALGLLLNVWGTTNETTVNMSLHDRGSQEMFWNYDWVARGSTFSSPDALVEGLMRNASRRMPYIMR